MKYKIKFASDLTTVAFDGAIDEHIGPVLAEIRAQIKTKEALFDLAKVGLVNSIGVSTWIAHMAAFDGMSVAFTRVPYTFISLCRIIPVLAQGRTIHSFEIRFYCDHCDDDEVQFGFVHREEALVTGVIKAAVCPSCKKPMEADPNDTDYVRFFAR